MKTAIQSALSNESDKYKKVFTADGSYTYDFSVAKSKYTGEPIPHESFPSESFPRNNAFPPHAKNSSENTESEFSNANKEENEYSNFAFYLLNRLFERNKIYAKDDKLCVNEPLIIAITGSVSSGKSWLADFLVTYFKSYGLNSQTLTSDNFIYENKVLEERGIYDRKGFPESYDCESMKDSLHKHKNGMPYKLPVYSHRLYDIVPGEFIEMRPCDILVFEGINILSSKDNAVGKYADCSVFIDADLDDIRKWFVARALKNIEICEEKDDKESYFYRFIGIDREDIIDFSNKVWHEINEKNYIENTLPHYDRADFILGKNSDHSINTVLEKIG